MDTTKDGKNHVTRRNFVGGTAAVGAAAMMTGPASLFAATAADENLVSQRQTCSLSTTRSFRRRVYMLFGRLARTWTGHRPS